MGVQETPDGVPETSSPQSRVAWPATGFCKGEEVWCRLAATGLSRKFVYESFEAVLQQFLVEID